MRIFGAVVLVFSVTLAGLSIHGLINATKMASGLSLVSEAFGEPLDPSDWLRHWVRASAINAALAGSAVIAGIGLLRRKLWGLRMWAYVATASLGSLLILGLVTPKYQFEVSGPGELLAASLVTLLSWAVYFRRARASAALTVQPTS